jgi:hypothetical protein
MKWSCKNTLKALLTGKETRPLIGGAINSHFVFWCHQVDEYGYDAAQH